MLKIRLKRTGKRNQPSFRIVVTEARSKQGGKFTDLLGHYNPLTKPSTIKLDKAKYQKWIKKGAQPTDTVRHLAQKA